MITIIIFIFVIILAWLYHILANPRIGNHKIGSSEKGSFEWQQKDGSESDAAKMVVGVEERMIKFEPLTNKEKKSLSLFAKGNKYQLEALISIRHMLMTQKIISANREIHQYRDEIIRLFKENKVDQMFQLPLPASAIMGVISGLGQSNNQTLEKVKKYTAKHNPDLAQKKILEDATKFENQLSDWLIKKGLEFQVQENLVEEQMQKHGRAISTPDILFDEPTEIKVNGVSHLIRWIDAKNYFLIDVPFIIKSLEQQAEKYVRDYGPGAFVFHYGFDPTIHFSNVLILSFANY